ncbi:hypothetical protein ABNF65_21985 [Paenibacillus larvae]
MKKVITSIALVGMLAGSGSMGLAHANALEGTDSSKEQVHNEGWHNEGKVNMENGSLFFKVIFDYKDKNSPMSYSLMGRIQGITDDSLLGGRIEEISETDYVQDLHKNPRISRGFKYYINSVVFSSFTDRSFIKKYRVEIDGVNKGAKDKYPTDVVNKEQKVNLLEYNGGRGVRDTSSIKIYAITSSGNEHLVFSHSSTDTKH